MIERFAERAGAAEVGVHRAAGLEAARALARELIDGATVARWADGDLDGIATAEAAPGDAEVSLVRATLGVAETGTVALVHGPGRPRGAGVLPSRQVVLLRADELRATLGEALAELYGAGGAAPASVVLVAGPSRTSDIEQRSIRGVHAPRDVDVIVYDGPLEGAVHNQDCGQDARRG